MDKCLNCGEILSGKFCFNCGQKSNITRYSFVSFIKETFTSILELDSDFLRTVKSMMLKPGIFIRQYLSGVRKKYNSPLKYLFIVLAINFAVTFILEKPAFEPVKIYTEENNQVFNQLITVFTNVVTIFFMFPLAFGLMISNRKEGFYFVEYFAFMLYIISHSVLLFICIQMFAKLIGAELTETIKIIIWVSLFTLFYFWSYVTFFNSKKNKILYFIVSFVTGILALIIPVFILGTFIKNLVQ